MLLLGLCPLAGAQVATYADVKAGKGAQLSAQELRELMPGASSNFRSSRCHGDLDDEE